MNLIAAVDQNWAIGNKNELLVRIPADQKFFRETTTGKVVVMGRKTLESFPNGLPLKNRTNIVLTHDHTYKVPGAVVVHDMDAHKGIIIGKGGAMLKKIGSNARFELERMLDSKVNLKLWVKVKKDWRDSDFMIKNFGYDKKEI